MVESSSLLRVEFASFRLEDSYKLLVDVCVTTEAGCIVQNICTGCK